MAFSFPLFNTAEGYSRPVFVSTSRIRYTMALSGILGEEVLDPAQLVLAQTEFHRADGAVYLIRPPPADDGRRDRRVPERLGYGDLARRTPVLPAYLLQQAHQLEVPGEPRLLEVVGVAAPVVGREVLDALGGHLAREQPAPHRRVDDDADVVLPAVREYLLLDAAVEHVVGRLEALDGGYLPYPLHLGEVEVRDPDVADLALVLELGHCLPALLNVLVGVGPVDLVEIYDVGLQASEALFALTLHRVLLEDIRDIALVVPHERALSKDAGPLGVGDALERAGDECLGVAEAVDGGGVHPVDPQVNGPPYGSHRLVVVLRSPGSSPAAPAYRPGPETYGCDLHLCPAELHGLQSSLLMVAVRHQVPGSRLF